MLPRLAMNVIGLLLGLAPLSLHAQQISGRASVIDGDTLTIGGMTVRLFGIDAPEGKQICQRDGTAWACGEEAASQLRSITDGHQVTCEGRGNDQNGRLVAVCAADGFDLNKSMVAAGWATAYRRYSEDYVGEEVRAKADRLGIWTSTCLKPGGWPSSPSRVSPAGRTSRRQQRRARSRAV